MYLEVSYRGAHDKNATLRGPCTPAPPGSLSHGNEDARASLLYPLADIDRTRASSKRYAFVAKLVAQSRGVAFCDIFETFDTLPDGGAAYLSDGTHLSPVVFRLTAL